MGYVCFYRPFYSPHNVGCLTVILVHWFVWWFLKVKADEWSGWLDPSQDLSLSPWRITVYSLMPWSSAWSLSWPPDGLWAIGTPSSSVHWPKLGHGGLMAKTSHHKAWGTGFLQLAYFVLCLWNFLFHQFIFPSLLSLNKIQRLPCSVIPFYTLFLFSQTLAGNLPSKAQGKSDHWHRFQPVLLAQYCFYFYFVSCFC